MLARLRAALRIEDLALPAWLGLAVPLLVGVGGWEGASELDDSGSALTGLVYVVVSLGAVLCLATFPGGFTGEAPRLFRPPDVYALGPFIGALAMVGGTGIDNLGLTSTGEFGPFLVLGALAIIAHRWLPSLSSIHRRMLMAPFVFITAGVFNGMMASTFDAFDFARLIAEEPGSPGPLALSLALPVAVTAPAYAMLVFAPGRIADPGGPVFAWLVRYLVCLAGLVIGASWLVAIGS
ncbi:hypothetical protein EDM76_07410 [bacterium]|nr:MAG: hypothetical protein EDM76_07410 [bacterium]MCL4230695.1 hypothetical protein [Dehalococcoidia bacterium]